MILTKIMSTPSAPGVAGGALTPQQQQQHKEAPSPTSTQANEVVLLCPLIPCLTLTREAKRK